MFIQALSVGCCCGCCWPRRWWGGGGGGGASLRLTPEICSELQQEGQPGYATVICDRVLLTTETLMPTCCPTPLAIPPPWGGNRHFDSIFFPLCSLVLPMLAPPVRFDSSLHSIYAIGAHVWYHSRSKGRQ